MKAAMKMEIIEITKQCYNITTFQIYCSPYKKTVAVPWDSDALTFTLHHCATYPET